MFFNRFLLGSLFEGEPGAAGAGTGEGNSGAAFDPEAFKASVLSDIDKKLNGFSKSLKTDFLKLIPQPKPNDDPDPNPDPNPGGSGDNKGKNPEVSILERKLKQQQDQLTQLIEENKRTKETAAKKEADSILRAEIAKHQLVPGAADDLFDILSAKVQRDDNGRLFAGEDVNLDVFVKDYIESRPHYLPPVNVNGAGSGRSTQHAAKALDFDLVKPGANQEILQRAAAEIGAFFANQK